MIPPGEINISLFEEAQFQMARIFLSNGLLRVGYRILIFSLVTVEGDYDFVCCIFAVKDFSQLCKVPTVELRAQAFLSLDPDLRSFSLKVTANEGSCSSSFTMSSKCLSKYEFAW